MNYVLKINIKSKFSFVKKFIMKDNNLDFIALIQIKYFEIGLISFKYFILFLST